MDWSLVTVSVFNCTHHTFEMDTTEQHLLSSLFNQSEINTGVKEHCIEFILDGISYLFDGMFTNVSTGGIIEYIFVGPL